MGHELDLTLVRDVAIAMLIGALVGIDREKKLAQESRRGIGGIRTFILLGLLGAVAALGARAWQLPWLLPLVVLVVGAMVLAGYILHGLDRKESIGLTTEMAALAVFLLGALSASGHPAVAGPIGIIVSAVLAFKEPLHALVEKIGREDIYAGLKLLIATFIVLPVLPNRAVDPWGAINPYQLWWLVILISSLSLVGYAATRWLGHERGLAITGFTGGLVSSTAVTLTFARRSREAATSVVQSRALAVGILLAWTVMFGRVIVEVAVVNPSLLSLVLVPCGAMGLAAAAVAAGFHFRATGRDEPGASTASELVLKNPFSLTSAMKFALFFAVVLLVVKGVQHYAHGNGLYLVAVLAGSTDVDAITLSMAGYAKQSGDATTAVRAITLAALSNTVVKAGLIVALGGAGLRPRTLLAAGIILAVGLVTLFAI
jgi:uncharacterized membrane protein (DUF4010 family)